MHFLLIFQNAATWFLLLTNLIPISLWVCLEGVNLIKAYFINHDLLLFDYHNPKKTDAYTKVQSSNLVDELGQIEYIFTDKSGTLTMNEMRLTNFTIGMKAYGNETQLNDYIVNN